MLQVRRRLDLGEEAIAAEDRVEYGAAPDEGLGISVAPAWSSDSIP